MGCRGRCRLDEIRGVYLYSRNKRGRVTQNVFKRSRIERLPRTRRLSQDRTAKCRREVWQKGTETGSKSVSILGARKVAVGSEPPRRRSFAFNDVDFRGAPLRNSSWDIIRKVALVLMEILLEGACRGAGEITTGDTCDEVQRGRRTPARWLLPGTEGVGRAIKGVVPKYRP